MSEEVSQTGGTNKVFHPRFAAFYNRIMRQPGARREFDPWRCEIIGQAKGVVLEVGAGGGQNFSFYNSSQVVRVEAVEPDQAMIGYARRKLLEASVPIQLSSAPVEALPFPATYFDSVLATLVFCSVDEPLRGLREIKRVLKPGGSLLLLEHVRSQGKKTAWVQDALVPLTTRLLGNCHWNRDTRQAVEEAGFKIAQARSVSGGIHPLLLLEATRPS